MATTRQDSVSFMNETMLDSLIERYRRDNAHYGPRHVVQFTLAATFRATTIAIWTI